MLMLVSINILDMVLYLMEVFSHPSGRFGNIAIIFRVDMSSFVHVDNTKKRHFDSW